MHSSSILYKYIILYDIIYYIYIVHRCSRVGRHARVVFALFITYLLCGSGGSSDTMTTMILLLLANYCYFCFGHRHAAQHAISSFYFYQAHVLLLLLLFRCTSSSFVSYSCRRSGQSRARRHHKLRVFPASAPPSPITIVPSPARRRRRTQR